MKNKKLEANLSMAVSKIFSGLNMNALYGAQNETYIED